MNYPSWSGSDILSLVGGLLLTITILAIAFLVKQPTEFQYVVFKSVLAVSAGLLTAGITSKVVVISSKIFLRIGLSAFVIVCFYLLSPAALFADQRLVSAEKLRQEYVDQNSEIRKAVDFLDNRMRQDDFQALYQSVKSPSEEILTKIDTFLKAVFKEPLAATAYEVELRFYANVAQCVKSGKCDRQLSCDVFHKDIESFRQFTCGLIADRDQRDSSRIADDLERFSVDDCRADFIDTYVDLGKRDFDNVCLPSQCWATNKKPPYRCQPKTVNVAE